MLYLLWTERRACAELCSEIQLNLSEDTTSTKFCCYWLLVAWDFTQGVKHQTVGIDSLGFSSNIFGNVVFYDFAGQREFHTSHAEISAQKVMGGVFVVVVNIAQSDDGICSCLHYWVSFIHDCSLDMGMHGLHSSAPTSPVPPFLLMQNLFPKNTAESDIARQKSHDKYAQQRL